MYDFGKYKMTPSSRIQRPSAVTEEILPEVIYKFSTLLPPSLDRTILERSSNISRRINRSHEMDRRWWGIALLYIKITVISDSNGHSGPQGKSGHTHGA